jgi:pimeloyl-ACP methyl ester carboxylesterase
MNHELIVNTIYFKETPVRFSELGKGRVIVLLHGFLESLEIWKNLSEKLSKKFRVVAIDLPGHGESGCLGYIHPMELMAESVHAVLKHLKIRTCLMAGHSMGGYVAMAYAESHPDELKGLCLFHSTAAADNELKKKDRDKMINLVKENKQNIVNQLIPNLFKKENRKIFEEEIKLLKKTARKTTKQSVIAALEGMKDRTEREIILRFSTYPVLFIIGKDDPVINYEAILEQSELPRNSNKLILENTAHMGFIEEKLKTEEAIMDFARTCYSGKKSKKLQL